MLNQYYVRSKLCSLITFDGLNQAIWRKNFKIFKNLGLNLQVCKTIGQNLDFLLHFVTGVRKGKQPEVEKNW